MKMKNEHTVGGLDALSVDDHVIAVNLKRTAPATVDGIVLELVGHVVGGGTGVDDLEVAAGIVNHDTGD